MAAHVGSVGELLPLFSAELELCRLQAGECVQIHSDVYDVKSLPLSMQRSLRAEVD